MSAIVDCPACMRGEHAGHVGPWFQQKDMIGGYFCACKGDCAGRYAEMMERITEALLRDDKVLKRLA